MTKLPETEDALLVRTDFSDDTAWRALSTAIQKPVGEFRANLTLVDDPSWDGATVEQVVESAGAADHVFVFIADHVALTDPEQAVLVVDLDEEPGRSFRVIPAHAWSVENNLSLANMDFDEFVDAVDDEGVFRGFDD